jgi:hypothetical protein
MIAKGKAGLKFKDFSGEQKDSQILPFQDLLSPSVPDQEQRPIASFYRGEVPQYTAVDWDILIISQRLYLKLSPIDQCAVQIHERLRYLNTEGQKQSWSLLKRPLTTQEIELITAQIINDIPISEDRIPATPFFEAMAKFGLEKIQKGASELNYLETANKNYSDMTLDESATLYVMSNRMQEGVEEGWEAINIVRREQRFRSFSSFFRHIFGDLPSADINLEPILLPEK